MGARKINVFNQPKAISLSRETNNKSNKIPKTDSINPSGRVQAAPAKNKPLKTKYLCDFLPLKTGKKTATPERI